MRLCLICQRDPIAVEISPEDSNAQTWLNRISRAYRYAPDYPGLQHYDLTPKGTLERYRDGALPPAN